MMFEKVEELRFGERHGSCVEEYRAGREINGRKSKSCKGRWYVRRVAAQVDLSLNRATSAMWRLWRSPAEG